MRHLVAEVKDSWWGKIVKQKNAKERCVDTHCNTSYEDFQHGGVALLE
jgi:hypothetical protein